MKKLTCSFLLLLLFQWAAATSIVIVVTPQYIVIGSDSKRQLLRADAQVAAEQTVQKIRSAGPYCFAIAGLSSASATSFSPSTIVAQHLQQAGSYAAAIRHIRADIKKALQKELRYQQAHQPEAYRKIITSGQPLLELVVLSMQEGKPQMELIGFELDAQKGITLSSYTARCPGDCPSGSRQVYFMGSYGGMEQYLAQRALPIAEPAELVEQLIHAQARATPTSVGAPVHLVKFSASGMEWIR